MEQAGLCDLCGSAGKLFTCNLCGRRVCMRCYLPDKGVCVTCSKGRRMKPKEAESQGTDGTDKGTTMRLQ